MLLKLFGAVN